MSAIEKLIGYAGCTSGGVSMVAAARAELTAMRDELERVKQANYQQIKDGSELMLALLEDRPIGGEYIHAVHCNADRREPVGNDMCACRIGKRIKQIRAERDQLRTQLAEQSAKMVSLEAQIGDQRNHLEWFGNDFVAIEKALNGESSDALCRLAQKAAVVVKQRDALESQMLENNKQHEIQHEAVCDERDALESQAGAMREAANELAYQVAMASFMPSMSIINARIKLEAVLGSSQAGADLLKRVQALEADKKRLEHRLDVIRCDAHYINLDWCDKQTEAALLGTVIRNIRKWADHDAALSQAEREGGK